MADYAHYGNPLKELDIDEAPKKFKDETVRDEKGRRRFHGAFTGGFSAGYFNTVDTKEGWAPSQFISSRSSRANKPEQKPQDYMDTEDLGDLGFAPQRLQLRDGARIAPDDNQSTSLRAGVGSQRELLSAPLKRILKGDRDSVGVLILRQMGWRDGKGIGPKVCLKTGFGPQQPPFLAEAEVAPDDIEFTEIKGTDKVWGLGYTPTTRLDLFGEKVDRERLTQTTAKVEGRRLGIRGQAFGVGAFEEDDEDIYARDDMTQYAFEEVDHRPGDRARTPKHAMIESGKKQALGGLMEGFVAVEVHVSSAAAKDSSIVIPPGWKPSPPREKNQTIPPEMTREQKVASLFQNLPEGSVFNFLSEDARAKIEATKRAMIERKKQSDEVPSAFSEVVEESDSKSGEETTGNEPERRAVGAVDVTALRPFAKDPMKQERFDRFVAFAEKGHREMLPSIQPTHFSAWEAALEKKEFEAALAIVRPKLGLTNRFENRDEDNPHSGLPTGLTSANDIPTPTVKPETEASKGPPMKPLKDFGPQSHARFVWYPASVLCKRFNVPDPYPGHDFVGIPSSSLLLDQPQTEIEENAGEARVGVVVDESNEPSTSQAETPKRSEQTFTTKTRIEASSVEPEREKPPPPIDILKMIFSDEEEEENDVSEPKDEDKTVEVDGTVEGRENPASERKNTGIFANIDLSLLNKRPPPKPAPSAASQREKTREAEEQLIPMGPKPPPILAIETETFHKLTSKKTKKKHKQKAKKRKKDAKSKKKKTKKKKEKHRKRKRTASDSSSSEDESSSSDEDHEECSSTRSGKRKKRRKKGGSSKHRSSSSSSGDSDGSSDGEDVDERLKKKLKSLRSSF